MAVQEMKSDGMGQRNSSNPDKCFPHRYVPKGKEYSAEQHRQRLQSEETSDE